MSTGGNEVFRQTDEHNMKTPRVVKPSDRPARPSDGQWTSETIANHIEEHTVQPLPRLWICPLTSMASRSTPASASITLTTSTPLSGGNSIALATASPSVAARSTTTSGSSSVAPHRLAPDLFQRNASQAFSEQRVRLSYTTDYALSAL